MGGDAGGPLIGVAKLERGDIGGRDDGPRKSGPRPRKPVAGVVAIVADGLVRLDEPRRRVIDGDGDSPV